MASPCNNACLLLLSKVTFLLLISCSPQPSSATARKLNALVKQQPLVLNYHNGPLLKGNYAINLVWYGSFTPSQKSIVIDFIESLTPKKSYPPSPSVASWWKTTEGYKGGSTTFSLGQQLALGSTPTTTKLLKSADLVNIAARVNKKGAQESTLLTVILTSADVTVEGFCSSRCGTHGTLPDSSSAYIWVGDSASQCPGQCAWPFHQPIYGPQTPPLIAPNNDVGLDGMVINLATLLAGTVTNPYGNGYFQGPKEAPLEAVSACTGVFGKGAYSGYPGQVLVDNTTGASYNARGFNGRKFLLPAMWDPKTFQCSTQVV